MKQYRSFITLSFALIILAGYQFIGADWTPAPSTPPGDNADAPINIGTTTQSKEGNLNANIFAASTEMRSDRYCDSVGENCTELSNPGTQVVSTLREGWPDVIKCTSGSTVVFAYIDYAPYTGSVVTYRSPASGNVYIGGYFNLDGSSSSFSPGFGDCAGKTIQQIISEGRAWSLNPVQMTEGGPGGWVGTSYGMIGTSLKAVAGTAGYPVYSSPETRATLCEAVKPGSTPIYWTNHSYSSPSDNYVTILKNGAWTTVGAKSYNLLIKTIYCN